MALWTPEAGAVSFGELLDMARRKQRLLADYRLMPGEAVLIVDALGPRLYAQVIAILALGATVILVEPWMPVPKIDKVLNLVKPRLFLTNWLGRLWGTRIPSVRAIPHWVSTSRGAGAAGDLHLESVPDETPGILTFTSGTTGNPKGVVRHQSYLVSQYEVLTRALGLGELSGPDLCIFANFALANMAAGRGSVIVPSKWKAKVLRSLDASADLMPESLTAGPAFLLQLMRTAKAKSLKSIHIGGALTDRWIFEKGFETWPEAHWTHIYGSSEAEPVSTLDARVAVEQSRARGLFQTLALGSPVSDIRSSLENDGAWVAGPHVCPRYVGNEEENRLNKRRDPEGNVWHFLGDRVVKDDQGWWYAGRSQQSPDDFALEQKVYSFLGASHSFIHRDPENRLYLVGKKLESRAASIQKRFPEIHQVIEAPIFRDLRHQARLDRKKTLQKGAPWLAG